jgi:hypothetical protein
MSMGEPMSIPPTAGEGVGVDEADRAFTEQPLVAKALREKFTRLKAEWKAGRGPHSSMVQLVMHPAYQKIIGMGPGVVPLLLRELEDNLDIWFWALRAITEENPVPKEARGDGEATARSWLDWARQQGIWR